MNDVVTTSLEELKKCGQPGDLLMFTNARGLNRLITWYSRAPWYHIAFYAGGSFVVEARPRGVVRRDLRGPDGDKAFVWLPAPYSRATAIGALRWAEDKIGLGYDPLNVGALVLDRSCMACHLPSLQNNRYSCGELIVEALRENNFDPLPDIEAADALPSDFAKFLPEKYQIWHGAPRGS